MSSVELQRFRERLFVTGESWGVEVPPDAPAAEIGRFLLRGLDGERARRRPLVESLSGLRRRDRAEERWWARFCRRVAGVEVAEYRPEIRVELLDLGEGALRLRPVRFPIDPEQDALLPVDVAPDVLGGAALTLLTATPPEWPAVRVANVHVASRKRLVVHPSRFWAGGPIRIVNADEDAAVLGHAVRRALADSDDIDPESDRPPDFWEQLLASAGLTSRQLAGRRAASVAELADGSVQIEAMRAVRGGWDPVGKSGVVTLPDPDAERLGSVILAATVTWDPWSGSPLADGI